jgi:hypothetical protein
MPTNGIFTLVEFAAHLKAVETRQNLAAELAETFGAEGAALFADRFVATVMGRRRELLSN